MKNFNIDNALASGTGSKGNQLKFKDGDIWYKVDYLGYEAAAELAVTDLLRQSNLDSKEYIEYDIEKISLTDPKRGIYKETSCTSNNFLQPGETLHTLYDFYYKIEQKDLSKVLGKLSTYTAIKEVVDFVEENTGLKNFGEYLTKLLELDAFTFNEDRHLNNIAFIEKENGEFRLCPIFDNGAAFMSDLHMYKTNEEPLYLRAMVPSKPFSDEFNKQINAIHNLYEPQLKFSKNLYLSKETKSKIRENYGDQVLYRIEDTIEFSKRKYKDMISCMTFCKTNAIENEKINDLETKKDSKTDEIER